MVHGTHFSCAGVPFLVDGFSSWTMGRARILDQQRQDEVRTLKNPGTAPPGMSFSGVKPAPPPMPNQRRLTGGSGGVRVSPSQFGSGAQNASTNDFTKRFSPLPASTTSKGLSPAKASASADSASTHQEPIFILSHFHTDHTAGLTSSWGSRTERGQKNSTPQDMAFRDEQSRSSSLDEQVPRSTASTAAGAAASAAAQAKSKKTNDKKTKNKPFWEWVDHVAGLCGPVLCTELTAQLLVNVTRVHPMAICPMQLNRVYTLDEVLNSRAHPTGAYGPGLPQLSLPGRSRSGSRSPSPGKEGEHTLNVADRMLETVLNRVHYGVDRASWKSVRLAFLDADHCPGAGILYAWSLSTGQVYLHCGDFRASAKLRAEASRFLIETISPTLGDLAPTKILRATNTLTGAAVAAQAEPSDPEAKRRKVAEEVASSSGNTASAVALPGPAHRGLLDAVFLDNTYLAPRHRFPPVERVFRSLTDYVRRIVLELAGASAPEDLRSILFVVGTYSIGKENVVRVVSEAAQAAEVEANGGSMQGRTDAHTSLEKRLCKPVYGITEHRMRIQKVIRHWHPECDLYVREGTKGRWSGPCAASSRTDAQQDASSGRRLPTMRRVKVGVAVAWTSDLDFTNLEHWSRRSLPEAKLDFAMREHQGGASDSTASSGSEEGAWFVRGSQTASDGSSAPALHDIVVGVSPSGWNWTPAMAKQLDLEGGRAVDAETNSSRESANDSKSSSESEAIGSSSSSADKHKTSNSETSSAAATDGKDLPHFMSEFRESVGDRKRRHLREGREQAMAAAKATKHAKMNSQQRRTASWRAKQASLKVDWNVRPGEESQTPGSTSDPADSSKDGAGKDSSKSGDDAGPLPSSAASGPDLRLVKVPYSEHSSFPELRALCEGLFPVRVVPTVPTEGGGGRSSQSGDTLVQKHLGDCSVEGIAETTRQLLAAQEMAQRKAAEKAGARAKKRESKSKTSSQTKSQRKRPRDAPADGATARSPTPAAAAHKPASSILTWMQQKPGVPKAGTAVPPKVKDERVVEGDEAVVVLSDSDVDEPPAAQKKRGSAAASALPKDVVDLTSRSVSK